MVISVIIEQLILGQEKLMGTDIVFVFIVATNIVQLILGILPKGHQVFS